MFHKLNITLIRGKNNNIVTIMLKLKEYVDSSLTILRKCQTNSHINGMSILAFVQHI